MEKDHLYLKINKPKKKPGQRELSDEDKEKNRRISWQYVIILLFTWTVHGLLLFNDGVYWDGQIIYTKLMEKEWDTIFLIFSEAGLPITAYFHWFMGYFPRVIFTYKLVAWLSILLAGVLVYKICEESRLISRWESLFIVLISLSYPAFQVSIELMTIRYIFFYFVFLLAILLAIRSESASGIAHYGLRVCSLVIFFLSFELNSLLVLVSLKVRLT